MAESAAKILRPDDYRRMPWKNGGGVTVEIAIHPPGATLDTFDWRVSMASVVEDGPFSRFPDIDRTLSVLTGKGLELFVAGDDAVTLTAESAPHSFAADAETRARLIDGPLADFNVMTRRGRCRHMVLAIADGSSDITLTEGACLLVYCCEGSANIVLGDRTFTLAADETLLVPAGGRLAARVNAGTGSRILAVVMTPV
ncbi:HutD family protein [Rhizobium sp. NRK18]|uniref:HutD/Ves family protein n=1 Tax=Rhizobium sp. NRK18 TaxID=2964667 RepID=UPI0021C37EFE|nr:HutD family protein [Rhizobium sp. NRK18]MCQ2003309.1 HutD family protein [Rhizobium sp. NRK18]